MPLLTSSPEESIDMIKRIYNSSLDITSENALQ